MSGETWTCFVGNFENWSGVMGVRCGSLELECFRWKRDLVSSRLPFFEGQELNEASVYLQKD